MAAQVDPSEVHSALSVVAPRISRLVLSIEHPSAHAVGNWDTLVTTSPVPSRRIGRWPAIRTGRLVAWGRKPWLVPRIRQVLRNP